MSDIGKTGKKETDWTVQKMMLESFDRFFKQNTIELLGYDPLTQDADGVVVGGLKRITTRAFGEYVQQDIDESGVLTYLGYENLDGDFYIIKVDATSGKSIRFGTINNNATRTTYALAWSNRATLTYDTYSTAFTA